MKLLGMSSRTFSILALACGELIGAPPTERWSLLCSGEIRGTLVMTPTGKGSYRLRENYALRGFTDDLRGELKVDAEGVPTRFAINGTLQSMGGYREFFQMTHGQAAWSLAGENRRGVRRRGFYLPNATTFLPFGLVWMGNTAKLRHGGNLPIVTGGEVRASGITPLNLKVGGRTITVQQQTLTGLGLSPFYLWRDDRGEPLAALALTDMAIRKGQEGLATALEQAAGEDLKQRIQVMGASARIDMASTFALTQVDLFDPGSRTVKRNQTVLVDGGRIKAVGAPETVLLPDGVKVLPLAGKTLVPGLWDSHFHIGIPMDGLQALASGAVCVYSPGDDPRIGPDRRKEWDQGREVGPWCLSAMLLDGSGPNSAQVATVVDSREEALKAFEKAHADGYFGIKLYGSLKKEMVPFLIEEGRKQGFWVSGHVPAGYTIQDLVGLGFREANHIYFAMLGLWPDVKDKTNGMARFTTIGERALDLDLKGKAVRDLIGCFKANGTVIDPTAVVLQELLDHEPGTPHLGFGSLFDRLPAVRRRAAFLNPDLADKPTERARNKASFRKVLGFIRELHEAGVPVVPGTDNYPEFSLAQELTLYVEGGIPASDVLALATIGAAKVFGQDKETGSIEVGKRADFVLVEGDPVQDIRNLERMVWVSKGGTVYDREKLLEGFGLSPKKNVR